MRVFVATSVLGIALVLVAAILPPIAVGRAAIDRGRRFGPWFAASLIFWPLVVLVLFSIENLTRPSLPPAPTGAYRGQIRPA